jgi:hypothetical protein
MFASFSRLDLGITVGPKRPEQIKTILSGYLLILVNYQCMDKDITGSALWRMRATLRHHDRVRRITFTGTAAWINEFIRATNCPFHILERLSLRIRFSDRQKLPDTILRGPTTSYIKPRLSRIRIFIVRNGSQQPLFC